MNREHWAPRVMAQLLPLLLASCSPAAQTASTAQEFMDTKFPGVVGAIKNALGWSTGNPEIDAALGAASVIQEMEESDTLEQQALVAASHGDARTAEENITAAMNGRPSQLVDITALGVALECGEESSSARRITIEARARFFKDRSKAEAYLQRAIEETKNALSALDHMNLPEKERRARQAVAANTVALLYERRASFYNDQEPYRKNTDLAYAATFKELQQKLESGQ